MSAKHHAFTLALLIAAPATPALAQSAADAPVSCLPQGPFGQMDYTSVEVLADGRVTFRLCAPEAQEVRVTSTDIDPIIPAGFGGGPRGLPLTRDDSGLWSGTTTLPIPADTYRFNFEVDGARVPDPLATTFSRERSGINSTFEVIGPEGAFQSYDPAIPHGVVSRIEYWSSTLNAKREAYVYTPSGYMTGSDAYPVLYLVHGAGDSADSWTSVGHANYIADNLIAAGEAERMIIVMPFGHTPVRNDADMLDNTDFGDDLTRDLIPFVDSHFRTIADADHRAMAGLSMGGAHTLRFGVTRPDLFGEVGIFSMGLGMAGPSDITDYVAANADALKARAALPEPVYYAIGSEDFLYGTSTPTRAMFTEQGIAVDYNESGGGHTWINWRRYLKDFLPRLFR
tara:strand:+ start:4952 stop:6145 length:1194 start_codon:yes stop_codon:yes gene_type:complete